MGSFALLDPPVKIRGHRLHLGLTEGAMEYISSSDLEDPHIPWDENYTKEMFMQDLLMHGVFSGDKEMCPTSYVRVEGYGSRAVIWEDHYNEVGRWFDKIYYNPDEYADTDKYGVYRYTQSALLFTYISDHAGSFRLDQISESVTGKKLPFPTFLVQETGKEQRMMRKWFSGLVENLFPVPILHVSGGSFLDPEKADAAFDAAWDKVTPED